jgi:dolichol-phosphate mannosyltransferase
MMDPEISIVAPLFNEAPNVQPLAQRIVSAFEKQTGAFEILLVNDGSTDDTWDRIQDVCRGDSRVRGLRHEKSAGQSAALWTGFNASRAPIIATLDGDLQNDPDDLPRMIEELKSFDMVCGHRSKRMDTSVRRLSSRIARRARSLVFGVDFADTGCNLRVFKRWIIQRVPPFDGLHRFLPILAHNAGAKVKEVPVMHHPRTAGVSKYGVWNRLGRGVYDLIMVRLYLRRQLKNAVIAANNSCK